MAILFILIVVIFCISEFGENYFFKKKAMYLAEKEYFIHGCLSLQKVYFYKNSFKEYDVNIDGKVYYYLDVSSINFPFSKKSFYFYKNIKSSVKCYPIKYIEVDILNSRRVYIYDLI